MKDIQKLINEILELDKTKNEILLKKNDIRTLLSYIKHQNDLYEKALKDYDELKEENQRLKERIEYLERSNNRREDTIMSLRNEITEQKDCESVLNELEKWVYQFIEEHKNDTGIFDKFLTTREVLDKINKLKESDK